MKKILVALLVAMLALIATVALAETCPTHGTAGHVYDVKGEITKTPTCQTLGARTWSCSCGAETTKDISFVDHNYEWKDIVPATCQSEGYDLYICEWCNDSYKTPIAKVDHKYEWKTVAATCIDDGSTVYKCAWCGDTPYTEIEYATGHKAGEWVKIEGKDTCTTDATDYYKCSKCGVTFPVVVNNITKHAWSDWKLTLKGDCITDGEETRVCANDATHVEKRTVVAKGHQIVEESIKTNDKGVVVGYCSVCGKFVPVDEKPVVKPSETEKPAETQKPEEKPTTKPTTKPSTPNKPTTNNSGVTIPATGETMNVAPFIMMLVAIVGLAVTKQKVTE